MTAGKLGGFSNARYTDVVVFFGLEPMSKGSDIERYTLKPVYIPNKLFGKLLPHFKLSKHNMDCWRILETSLLSGICICSTFPSPGF